MSNTANDVFKIVEAELIKFGSAENTRKVLSKYMIGFNGDPQVIERVFTILSAEFRQTIEKIRTSLPEDDIEAAVFVENKAARSRTIKSMVDDPSDIEIVEESELQDFDED